MEEPIKYPSVSVEGVPYVLKVTVGTVWDLEDDGLSLKDFGSSFKNIATILHKCLGTMVDGKWHQTSMTAKELAHAIPLIQMQEFAEAFTKAVAKVQPPTKTTSDETTAATPTVQ